MGVKYLMTKKKSQEYLDSRPKRGDLKPMDAYEESIRKNAVCYNVVGFIPGSSHKSYQTFDNLIWAKAYAQELMKNTTLRLRTAMIYAIDEYQHHALVGTMDRELKWKEVVPARY